MSFTLFNISSLHKRPIDLWLALFFILLFASCGNKNVKDEGVEITGRWEIYDALRNGRSTSTLKDGFMYFSPENELETNITGELTQSSFQLNGDNLSSSEPFAYDFKVMKLTADSLHLLGRMRSFHMDFYLLKANTTTQDSLLIN